MSLKTYITPLNYFANSFNITDSTKYEDAVVALSQTLFDRGATMFVGDNLITWNKTYSFLRDPFYQDIVNSPEVNSTEKSFIWRTYTLLHFAELASKAEGDYVELGCHTGYSAGLIIKKLEFQKLAKKYYLYDLFEWNEGDEHTRLHGHYNENMYEDVLKKFAPYPFATITKGSVPETLEETFPEKIAFAHVDMNHPTPEAGAMKKILPRLSKGGIVICDDYGWWGYSAQKLELDPIFDEYGYKILELPTGQGVLINI